MSKRATGGTKTAKKKAVKKKATKKKMAKKRTAREKTPKRVAAKAVKAALAIAGDPAPVAAPVSGFEPRIVVFACNWCSYAGADYAGVSRQRYAPDIRIVRVMCSGRVNPGFIFKAFEAGADGVLVSGCHPGDCHYSFGNLRARENIAVTRKLLHLLGIEPERFRLEWFTAAEGARFAAVVNELVEDIKQAGPSIYRTRPAKRALVADALAAMDEPYPNDRGPHGEKLVQIEA